MNKITLVASWYGRAFKHTSDVEDTLRRALARQEVSLNLNRNIVQSIKASGASKYDIKNATKALNDVKFLGASSRKNSEKPLPEITLCGVMPFRSPFC